MNQHVYQFLLSTGIGLLMMGTIKNNCYAQSGDPLLQKYNNQTIYTSGKYYAKGSELLTYRGLKSEFTSTITKSLYRKSKNNAALSWTLTVTSVAAAATAAIIRKNNTNAAIGLSVASIALNLGGLHFRNHATQYVDKALWLRNREVLFNNQ